MSTTNYKSTGGFDANNQAIKNVADALNAQDAVNLQVLTAKNTVQPYNQTRTYPVDFIVEYNGQLWKCITPVTVTGGLFDKTKWKALAGQENWLRITASYTANGMDSLLVDTTSTAITITLPAVVASGDYLIIQDAGNAAVNNITINRNGQTINGVASNAVINESDTKVTLVYLNGTWILNTIRVERVKISSTGVNALSNQSYAFDVTSNLSVNLPASPKNGDWVEIIDRNGGLGTNNITVYGNTKQIDGSGSTVLNQKKGSWRIIYNGTAWATYTQYGNSLQTDKNLSDLESVTQARINMNIGSVASLNAGTGSGDVRTNGQNDARFQPLDGTLSAMAILTTAANQMMYSNGPDSFAMATLTPQARVFLNAADVPAQHSVLGLGNAVSLNVGNNYGDLVTVGAFGLGYQSIINNNPNTITTSGFYSVSSSALNAPSLTYGSTVLHIELNTAVSAGATQFAIDTNNTMYWRNRNSSSVWTSWVSFSPSSLGNAAYRTVGLNASNVMEVGAFGLGSTILTVVDATTINNILPTGTYSYGGGVGPNTNAGIVEVYSSGTRSVQLAMDIIADNLLWIRRYNGSWSSWGAVQTNTTIATAVQSAVASIVGAGSTTSLMGVGAFGLGVNDAQPDWPNTALSNCNTVRTGIYRSTGTTTGLPGSGTSNIIEFWIRDAITSGQFHAMQRVTNNTTGRIYIRIASGSGSATTPTWGAWAEELTTIMMFPAWTSATYSGTWVDFSATYNGLQYRLEGNRVYFRGVIKNATTGTNLQVATLPTGYRPVKQKAITVSIIGGGDADTSGWTTWITIQTNGVMTILDNHNAGLGISLDGLSFEID